MIKRALLPAAILAFALLGSDNRPHSSGRFDGDLLLPGGFEVVVIVDSLGPARHLAVRENGDIYVKLRRNEGEGSIVAMRDTTGDGVPDVIGKFGFFTEDRGGYHTEARIHEGYLYVSTQLRVYRYRLSPDKLLPETDPDTLVIDDHAHGSHEHITKPVAFDTKGNMYVPFGAPSNACQNPKRTPGVPGQDPCPELENHGGIWRFDKDKKNQTQADGERIATGLRSIVGMEWNSSEDRLYAVVHGRDDLHRLWPNQFSPYDNAILPADEFVRIEQGSDFGWPYCYYDQIQGKKVLAPEYGGDGLALRRCEKMDLPIIGFPGHFAPNDLTIYRGDQFPVHYRDGAFVALHGSTIRNPYPQAGYFVAFVPFAGGKAGEWEVFANGFAVTDPIVNTSDAESRPVGLAVGPDGSLYVSDSNRGKIWRIRFTGDRAAFGEAQLAAMKREKEMASNIRTPDRVADNLERDEPVAGEKIYLTYCAGCHQRDGNGAPPRYPPLAGTEWVLGDSRRLVSVILNGLEGPIDVNGESYDNVMPQHSFLDDEAVAEVATFIRQNFGNSASAVRAEEVKEVRDDGWSVGRDSPDHLPSYVVYRAAEPLTIDGRLDEAAWNAATWTSDFVEIEGGERPPPRLRTMAKMLWDDEALYVAAWLEEPDVWATLTRRDAAVYQDNAFEVFIDPDGDTHNYYELEINALETVWDLMLIRPYRDGGPSLSAWDVRELQARVHVDGTINNHADTDRGWSVEIALPWNVLREAAPGRRPPQDGDQWRINFARSQWPAAAVGASYRKAGEAEWWVWSTQGAVDMHRPERFGYVQFADAPAGGPPVPFAEDPYEDVKLTLRRLYNLQREYFRMNGRYAETSAELKEAFPPNFELRTTRSGYEIAARGAGGMTAHITQDGRVWVSGK